MEVSLLHSDTLGDVIKEHHKPLLDTSLESLKASVKVHTDSLDAKFANLQADSNRQFADLKSSLQADSIRQFADLKSSLQEQLAPFLRQVQEGMNARHLVSQRPLRLLCKTVPGHDGELEPPTDPAFQGLGRPVPIGTSPPSCAFCPNGTISRASLTTLTTAQLANFAWFYNEEFPGKLALDVLS
jgi:hypothetical protein